MRNELACTHVSYFGESLCFIPGSQALAGNLSHFYYQTGIAVSKSGQAMFIADTLDNVVREVYCETGNYF
jgi:sugar lactone lactonase YvrE